MSSSNSPAEIGSRPEVGSSRNSTPGSSASARARAARLIMPPESSEGNFSAASAGRPTSRSFSIASSVRSAGEMSRCSRIGASTFCRTLRLENSAPCWNSTPQPRSTRARSVGVSASRSRPSASIIPARLGCRPEDRARQHRLAGAGGADEARAPRRAAGRDRDRPSPCARRRRLPGRARGSPAAASLKTAPPRRTSRTRRRAG